MIVSERKRRLSAAKAVSDLQEGDCVRQVGSRRNGWVESVDADRSTVTVMWDGTEIRDVLNFAMVRKIPPRGHKYDSRGKA